MSAPGWTAHCQSCRCSGDLAGAAIWEMPIPAPADGLLTMEEAAKKLRRSYFWLARHWKKMGLHPSNFGHPYLFDEKEIDRYIEEHRYSYRGRPRKH